MSLPLGSGKWGKKTRVEKYSLYHTGFGYEAVSLLVCGICMAGSTHVAAHAYTRIYSYHDRISTCMNMYTALRIGDNLPVRCEIPARNMHVYKWRHRYIGRHQYIHEYMFVNTRTYIPEKTANSTEYLGHRYELLWGYVLRCPWPMWCNCWPRYSVFVLGSSSRGRWTLAWPCLLSGRPRYRRV